VIGLKRIAFYFKHNLYFMISLITVSLSVMFAVVMLFVLDLGESVEETSVGFIYLGSYSQEQYAGVLTSKVAQWQETADFELVYHGYEIEIDLSLFNFNVTETVSKIQTNQTNQAFFTISTENRAILMTHFEDNMTPTILSSFDMDSFLEDVLSDMSSLKNRKVYQLKLYLAEGLSQSVIQTITIDQIALADVNQIIEEVESIQILGTSRFSILKTLGTNPNLDNNQLSIIASALQKLTIDTHFEGYVYASYITLPSWAEPGMNVRVLKVNQFDFSFYNRLSDSFTVEIDQISNDSLSFTLKGYPYMTTYVSSIDESIVIPFTTHYIENLTIDETTPGVIVTETDTEFIYEIIITPGQTGKVISYFKTITPLNGTSITVKIYDEQYVASPEIREQNIVLKDGD
jgi:hypothetical protein